MRRKTIRSLPGPLTRDLARLQNDLASAKRRMDRLIERAAEVELKALALDAMEAPAVTVGEGEYLRVVQEGEGDSVLDRYMPGRYYLKVCRRERANAGQ